MLTSDTRTDLAMMLDAYDHPAILMTSDYEIVATNRLYRERFGELDPARGQRCYQVSHGYDVPCDQAGEDCPLAAARASGHKERVLHIHQTPRGREHVDVELVPVTDVRGEHRYYVELLKPVEHASPRIDDSEMVGATPAFNRMVEKITRVGPTEAAVLLLGESGTGKEMAALAVHRASQRRDHALVTLECSGLSETLFESELFGHVKGAFTGATQNKPGLVEAANGGTLFLDEVGDIPHALQVKLLRLIETGSYRPVGSTELRRADFRLICATHKRLHSLVERGEFRQDLYHRINVFPIHLPSLRERGDDIPLLAKAILHRMDGSHRHVLTDSAIRCLREHAWRGNIRELKNLLQRALVLADTPVVNADVIRRSLALDHEEVEHETPRSADISATDAALPDLKTHEQDYLRDLMERFRDDREQVARIAGISVRSLYRKLAD
ncbi:MAG: sigma-54 interaction domain-containing protein [Pseudomonadota bacterium]